MGVLKEMIERSNLCKHAIKSFKGSLQKQNTGLFGNFSQQGGGGLPNSQNSKPKKVPLNHPKTTQKTN